MLKSLDQVRAEAIERPTYLVQVWGPEANGYEYPLLVEGTMRLTEDERLTLDVALRRLEIADFINDFSITVLSAFPETTPDEIYTRVAESWDSDEDLTALADVWSGNILP